MRLRIAIGLYADDFDYREFSRVVDVPVMPQIIRVGVLNLKCDDADEELTYIVSDETYYLYWPVEAKKAGLQSAAERLAMHAGWLLEEGFVEDLNEDTDDE